MSVGDLTCRVSFTGPESAGQQGLRPHAVTGKEAREDGADGELVFEGRTGETATAGGAWIWAGQIAGPFYIDLSLLAIVNGAIAKPRDPS